MVGRVLPGPVEPGLAPPPATIEDPEPRDYSGRVPRDLVYPNFAVPKRAFAELGLFDVRMGVGTDLPGGEDNDFGYRLLRAGWRILYRPGPTVVHCAWRSTKERAALKRAYGTGQGAFYAKHLASADPFIAYRFARDVLRTARAAGIPVVLDAESTWEGAEVLLDLVDFPIVSRQFAEEWGETGSVRDGLRALASRGPRLAVVTLGERPAN